MTLPHSLVCVERMFSKLHNIKTLRRNRLTVENLEACILNFEHFGFVSIHIIDQMKSNYLLSTIIKAKSMPTSTDIVEQEAEGLEIHQQDPHPSENNPNTMFQEEPDCSNAVSEEFTLKRRGQSAL